MLILSAAEMRQVLDMDGVMAALEEAFVLRHQGKDHTPVRMQMPTRKGRMLCMPSFLEGFRGEGGVCVKIVAEYPQNHKRGLPSLHASVVLHDLETGKPLALMEGGYLTGARTAAASAIAAKYLCRLDSTCLGIIGCGHLSYFHVLALSSVLPIQQVLLSNRTPDKAYRLGARVGDELGIESQVVSSTDELVASSDVIVTVTNASEPVFAGAQVRDGATIIAVGAFTPDSREVDDTVIQRSKIYVDSYDGVLSEAGDILIPMGKGIVSEDNIVGDLAELVAGSVVGRDTKDDIVLFKSVGLAMEDVAAATMAYQAAIAQNIGFEVSIHDC